MNLKNKKFLIIGGAGLIGSHTVDYLLKEDVKEIRIFDNFTRGKKKEIACLFNLSKNPLNLQLNGYKEILNSPQQFANISNEEVSLGGNGFIFLRK